MLRFQAKNKRLITARTMRKMHVPAYAAVDIGTQLEEYRGVAWSVVKTMGIDIISSDDMEPDSEPVCIECMFILARLANFSMI